MKLRWLKSLFPTPGSTDRSERMRACTGALFGVVLTGACSFLLLGQSSEALWLIPPTGASAILLFATPSSPLAQPWSIIGGSIISSVIGVTCAKLIGSPLIAAAVAGSLAMAAMFACRCLHPPSGSVALTAVLGGPIIHAMGYSFVLSPVLLNSVLLLATALFFNNVTGRRYPHIAQQGDTNMRRTSDLKPGARLGMVPEDLDIVLRRFNQVLDVNRDDLELILLETERQVYLRRHGVTNCADIMSRDVVSVSFGTELLTAWDLLQKHRIRALPVIDRESRVIGILTRADFIAHANILNHTRIAKNLTYLLRSLRHTHSMKPEVAGQLMFRDVKTANVHQPIVELVSLMSDAGVHSMPVVDNDHKLVGMITQSDMVAALYETNLQIAADTRLP
jgi:CBS domain-containing membrane protein